MEDKLKVGFVCVRDASDITAWSGVPYHMLRHLRKQNVQVEIFSPLNKAFKSLLVPAKLCARLRRRNVTLDHFRLALRSYASQIERLVRGRPVDVILSTDSIPVSLLRCKQPVIIWTDSVFHQMHGYYSGAFQKLTRAAIRRGEWQEETALSHCTFAAYSSEWAANAARQLTDPRKVVVLPFGASIPVNHALQDVRNWRSSIRRTAPHRCELLFVGIDWERKGGGIAIETAHLLNKAGVNTTLKVVGCEPSGPLPDFVQVLGFLNKATREGRSLLDELFRSADFLILPTTAETNGIVFCEASAYGLPSIACATGGVTDYVRTGVNGVCLPPKSSPADFALIIRELLCDRARYEELSLGGFREYENRLNWGSSVRSLVDLCHSCCFIPYSNQVATL